MRKFLARVLFLIAIMTGCCGIIVCFNILFIGSQYKYNYQASLIDKLRRLDSIKEPKIILVGNSNLAFGIDSSMIEDAFGMPVVNLGLHGGLGNGFHEEIAKSNINRGDLVIVCHTSFNSDGRIDDPKLAWITLDNNMGLWRFIRPENYWTLLKAYPEYMKDTFFLWLEKKGNMISGGCYSRNAFNEYGDIVVRPEEQQMDVEKFFGNTASNSVKVPRVKDASIKNLNKYNKYIREQEATMLMAGYPIAFGKYASFDEQDFSELKEELQSKLDCDIISDYTDYFIPYKYFYDTMLHLTEDGAKLRTRQLIMDIDNWLKAH